MKHIFSIGRLLPPAKRPVYKFCRVCLSVCQTITLEENLEVEIYICTSGIIDYLQGVRVKFVYEGHRVTVNVKVTGAKG